VGIFQVRDMAECWEKAEYLLANPDRTREPGLQAQIAVKRRTHILDDYLAEIRPYL